MPNQPDQALPPQSQKHQYSPLHPRNIQEYIDEIKLKTKNLRITKKKV